MDFLYYFLFYFLFLISISLFFFSSYFGFANEKAFQFTGEMVLCNNRGKPVFRNTFWVGFLFISPTLLGKMQGRKVSIKYFSHKYLQQ
jgi:hypothetical protein